MSFRRYTLTDPAGLVARFRLVDPDPRLLPTRPRYNVAPSQGVPVLVDDGTGRRHFLPVRWGFQPIWVVDDPTRPPPPTARVESLPVSNLFRDYLMRRRCVVPADGLYVWLPVEGEAEPRPFLFHLREGGLFGMAGIFTGDRRKPDPYAGTVALVTLPNPAPGGKWRMPALVAPDDEAAWLDPRIAHDPTPKLKLLRPTPPEAFTWHPVSARVESPFEDDPSLVEPADV